MIAQEELEQVASHVTTHGLSEQVITELKSKFPGKHFTWCMEDDIHTGKPVYQAEAFSIYVVNSKEHCSVLTNDLDSASGYVLAETVVD
ncbi:hypothetical protein SAMN02745866_01802 [Alteromonadaceae bacterium Bs31]|nr:hypothetical protein SAMN02745866_01802 [Alteromonadaceae bacterium Bs31]